MSELKERDARELVINNHYLPNEESMRVYLKSEADKVIAEKDKEIEELCTIRRRLEEANAKVESLNDTLYNEWKILFKKWCDGKMGLEADK